MRNKDIEVLSRIIGYCNDIEFLKEKFKKYEPILFARVVLDFLKLCFCIKGNKVWIIDHFIQRMMTVGKLI